MTALQSGPPPDSTSRETLGTPGQRLPEGAAQRRAPTAAVVIFGASGDLAAGKLMPALRSLADQQLLAAATAVVGVARSHVTTEQFVARHAGPVPTGPWADLLHRTAYLSGSYDDPDTYRRLAHALAALPDTDGKVLFYLSTPPEAFLPIVDGLIDSGLADQGATGFRRLLVEKPYGHDRASAASLDDAVRRGFAEQQIFRIDHYLGKDTVQNLLALRQPAARASLGIRHSAASTRSAPA